MYGKIEIAELKYYKDRIKALLGLYLLFGFLSLLFLFSFSIELLYIYNLLLLVICFTGSILLYTREERACNHIMAVTIALFYMTVTLFFISYYGINYIFLDWDLYPNIIIFLVLITSFLIALFYGIYSKNIVNDMINEGRLNNDEGICDLFEKDKDIKTAKAANDGAIMGALSTIIPAIGVFIVYSLGYRIDTEELKQVIGVFAILVGACFIAGLTGMGIANSIQVLKYEKKTEQPMYTGLIKYIRREDEINQWRKERGLKPIKIKSISFFGDIEK